MQITVEDFYNFDIIFGMDDNNMTELRLIDEQLEPPAKCQIKLLGSYLNPEQDQIIRDPYFVIAIILVSYNSLNHFLFADQRHGELLYGVHANQGEL